MFRRDDDRLARPSEPKEVSCVKLNFSSRGRPAKYNGPDMLFMLFEDMEDMFGTAVAINAPSIVFMPLRDMSPCACMLMVPVKEGQADARAVA